MQDKDMIIRELIQRLDAVSVPQSSEPSAAEIESFSVELRKIYFNAFYVTDRKDYPYLKRWASLRIHPDKLRQTTDNSSKFTRDLSTTLSENIKSLPIKIFNEYVDYIERLAFEKDNIMTALNSIPAFWENNIQSYREDASIEDKNRVDLHNKQVLFYLLYCMNSYLLNIAIDCLYKHYRYPTYLTMALSYFNSVLNFLLLASLSIPVIIFFIQIRIIEVLYGIERILLNMVTQGHYYAYVERQFCIALGRGKVDINGVATEASDALPIEISEQEAFIKGQTDLNKAINDDYLILGNGDPRAHDLMKDSIKHNLCSEYNRKNSHEQLVQKSLWNHFNQVFSSQSTWYTILWGVCRLAIASAIFLCLTIPLTVLKNTILWICLAVEAIVLAAYLLIKSAVILLTALPVYLYDAALGQDRSSNANAIVLEQFGKDTVKGLNFFAKVNDTPLGRNAQEYISGAFRERLGYGSA